MLKLLIVNFTRMVRAVYEPTAEIDEAGIWKIQGYTEINSKVYHSLIEIFELEDNLL